MPRSPPSSSPMPPTAAGRGSARRSCSLSARASPASRTFPALVNSAVEGSVMAADQTVSESLATWIEGLRPGDLPEAARPEAENTINDTIWLSVAALETAHAPALRTAFHHLAHAPVF